MTQIKEVIDIKKLSHMQNISFTPDTWDNIETTEDLAVHHEKLMEQIIQQIKIDMYKDRYKTYDQSSCVLFLCPFLRRGNRRMKKSEKIEILEKEVTRLNELLEQSSAQEFVRLKEEMDKEVKELRKLKAKYQELIEETYKLKTELENNVRN